MNLLTNFWETVYPVIEDGDRELRAKPLSWMGTMLDLPLRSAPLVSEGYSWFAYKDSRVVGFEDQAKTDKDRKTRSKLIEDGKITPEVFDKAFADTPKGLLSQGGERPRPLSRRRWRRWRSSVTSNSRTMLPPSANSRPR